MCIRAPTSTDLAVTSNNTIYVVSKTNLYTADPNDGHFTLVGPISICGTDNVALTDTPGKLIAGDYNGAICSIDVTTNPPTVKQIGTVGNNMALTGDLVGVSDGSVYAAAYELSDTSGGTQLNNLLIKLAPNTGAM